MALAHEEGYLKSSMDGASVAELFDHLRKYPQNKPFLELREKRSTLLYPGFDADPTIVKLACFLFDHVTTNELAEEELEYLYSELDHLERGKQSRCSASPPSAAPAE